MDERYQEVIEKALCELFDRCHRLGQEEMGGIFKFSAHLLKLMQAEGVKLYLTGGMITSMSNDYTYLHDEGGTLVYGERHSFVGKRSLSELNRVEFAPYLQSYHYSSSLYPYNVNGLIVLSFSPGKQVFRQAWESLTIGLLEKNRAGLPAEVAAGLADMMAARELDAIIRITDRVLKNNGRANIGAMLGEWKMGRG